jgi:hypothetical protein
MAKTVINVGSAANDGTGDPLRTAFQSTNSNFDEVYNLLGDGSALSITGDVSVSAGAVAIVDDAVDTAKLGVEFTTSSAETSATAMTIDTDSAEVFTWTAGHSATLSFTNVVIGKTKTLEIIGGGGSYTLAFGNINGAAGTFNRIAGEFSDVSSTKNLLQIKFISASEAWYTISQIAT